MRKVIIDCDPGIDDLVALVVGLSSKELEVLGITTVAGNQILEKATRNALNIVETFGLDAKVYAGASLPLVREQVIAEDVHGDNGVGSVVLKESTKSVEKENAFEFIHRSAVEANGELEICAIGPLTNIALAIRLYPELTRLVKRLVIMGGGHATGNITPAAEFNIFADPEAAAVVFESGIPIEMVGLDATMCQGVTESDVEELFKDAKSAANATLKEALLDVIRIGKQFGHTEGYIHDLLAVIRVYNTEFMSYTEHRVDIETQGELTYGKTVVDMDGLSSEPVNTQVCWDFDKKVLLSELKTAVEFYE